MNHTTSLIETAWCPLPGQCARARNIPISLIDTVRELYREAGIPIRVKYRGPRAKSIGRKMPNGCGGFYKRTRAQASQYCLREDATHFSIYNK